MKDLSFLRFILMLPLHVHAICANRVFAQTFWQCRMLFARLIFFEQAANACAVWVLACTNKPQYVLLGVDTVWLCQLSLFVGSTIDHAMSSKGTAEEQQFLIEFIEEYRSLTPCAMVCDKYWVQEQEKWTKR